MVATSPPKYEAFPNIYEESMIVRTTSSDFLLGQHSRLQQGMTRITSFRFGKIRLRPDGSVFVRRKCVTHDRRIHTVRFACEYEHSTKTLTVRVRRFFRLARRGLKRFHTATCVYDDGSWWVKLSGGSPTPYLIDFINAMGKRIAWSQSCLDTILEREPNDEYANTPYHDIGPVRLMRDGLVLIGGQHSFTEWQTIDDVEFENLRVRRNRRSLFSFLTEKRPVLQCLDLVSGRSYFYFYSVDRYWYQIVIAGYLGPIGRIDRFLGTTVTTLKNLFLLLVSFTLVVGFLFFCFATLS